MPNGVAHGEGSRPVGAGRTAALGPGVRWARGRVLATSIAVPTRWLEGFAEIAEQEGSAAVGRLAIPADHVDARSLDVAPTLLSGDHSRRRRKCVTGAPRGPRGVIRRVVPLGQEAHVPGR